VRDSVSKGWVWDMKATIGEKTIRGFFQSDTGLIDYRFTHLKRGKQELVITAPYYESRSIEVDIRKGETVIGAPIELTGIEIPELAGFYAFEKEDTNQYLITMRPVTKENIAIQLHPAIEIWIGAKVRSWDPTLDTTLSEFDKQPLLYKGNLPWIWDSYPETQFRYIAALPYDYIKETKDASYAIEYLVVVPNLKKIDKQKFALITKDLGSMDDETMSSYIDSLQDDIFYYSDISYDVKRTR